MHTEKRWSSLVVLTFRAVGSENHKLCLLPRCLCSAWLHYWEIITACKWWNESCRWACQWTCIDEKLEKSTTPYHISERTRTCRTRRDMEAWRWGALASLSGEACKASFSTALGFIHCICICTSTKSEQKFKISQTAKIWSTAYTTLLKYAWNNFHLIHY